MKKKVFLLLMTLMMVVAGCSSGGKELTDSELSKKAKPAHAVSLRNDYDDSAFEHKEKAKPEYVIGEDVYGLRYDVPSYMHKSDDSSRKGYLVYIDNDDNGVSYVSCQVSSDAWPDVELKDISEIGMDDAVYEETTGNAGDGYRKSAHYFFMTDKTNAGEHEMQVLVTVTAGSEESCVDVLQHIMESMDFSEFYFDNFAE